MGDLSEAPLDPLLRTQWESLPFTGRRNVLRTSPQRYDILLLHCDRREQKWIFHGLVSVLRENDIADVLHKEAAIASNQPDCRSSTTLQETKEAIKKTQLSKWQSRWDNTDYGRAFHIHVPKVDSKFLDISSRKSFCQILQMQTIYSKLNNYRHKLGQCDSNQVHLRGTRDPDTSS